MILGLYNSGHSGYTATGHPDVGEFCIYFSGINQVFLGVFMAFVT